SLAMSLGAGYRNLWANTAMSTSTRPKTNAHFFLESLISLEFEIEPHHNLLGNFVFHDLGYLDLEILGKQGQAPLNRKDVPNLLDLHRRSDLLLNTPDFQTAVQDILPGGPIGPFQIEIQDFPFESGLWIEVGLDIVLVEMFLHQGILEPEPPDQGQGGQ